MVTLYRTFALYEEKLEFNVLQGRVPEYTSGDVKIAAIIDGEKSNTIPSKNDGYVFESVTCDNGATGEWDNDRWGLFTTNLSKSKTTCTLSFKTNTSKPVIDYITSLAETSEDLAYDGTVDNNLRYIGANPNNYVLFNNELWRIIGLMNNIKDSDGNIGSHIKIIKNESIGNYYWSGSSTNENNDWTKSTLNTETLNGTYYNELSDEAKSMISNVVWNLGGQSTRSNPTSTFYTVERGDSVCGNSATLWTGRIGLMYPSDYGFAVGGNVREICLKNDLDGYRYNDCYTNDWLFLSEKIQFTLTPFINSRCGSAMYIYITGAIGYNSVSSMQYNGDYKPVLYLNSNVEITGDGDGSEQNPYQLKIPNS